MPRLLMLSRERVRRTIVRLAYEIVEANRGAANLVFFGIPRGGEALARALVEEINEYEGTRHTVLPLDVTPFRDDRDRPPVDPALLPPRDRVADRNVILVDDVLFTGRTARAALDALVHAGRPRTIQLAVLIDRGHREYPILANFVGRTIKTKHRERVIVEEDGGFAVYVEEE